MSNTYKIGEEDLSVTYNYAWIFYKLHPDGLGVIHGLTGKEALKILIKFKTELTTGAFGCANKEKHRMEDYWICSPNNCYHNAVAPLINMAKRNLNKKFR
jgi:hypothetical protein